MSLTEQICDGYTLLRAAGMLDMRTQTSQDLLELLYREESQIHSDYVLDLSKVEYINSGMLGALVRFLGSCHGSGHRFVLLGPVESVFNILCMTGLDELLPIVSTEDEAHQALQTTPQNSKNETRGIDYQRLTEEFDQLLLDEGLGRSALQRQPGSELRKLLGDG